MEHYSHFHNLPHYGSSTQQLAGGPLEWLIWEVRFSLRSKCIRQLRLMKDWGFRRHFKHSFFSFLWSDFVILENIRKVSAREALCGRNTSWLAWLYEHGPTTSFLLATLAIFADPDRMPVATAIRIHHGERWLAWLGWREAQLASIML